MVTITGDNNDDILSGITNDDSEIFGLGGNDTSNAGSGSDTLIGGLGNDTLAGNGGADTYIFSKGDGIDKVTGDNADTVQFTNVATTDITAIYRSYFSDDLVIEYGVGDQVTIKGYFVGLDAGYLYSVKQFKFTDATWTLADIAKHYNGSAKDDYIRAIKGTDNIINGMAGNDRIEGGDSNDTLIGGDGNDAIYDHGGNTIFIGGTGDDNLYGEKGADTYVFSKGDGNDRVYFNSTDTLSDTVQFTDIASTDITAIYENLSGRALVIEYGAGDKVSFQLFFGNSSSSNPISQFKFTDTTWTLADFAQYHNNGTASDDYLEGLNGVVNNINGFVGDDYIFGGDLNDTLIGGDGNDRISGRDGNDTLYGGDGFDDLDGGKGADLMVGGIGSDHYTVDNVLDIVVENANEGDNDTVSTDLLNYTLGDNIETLILFGSLASNGTGNGLDNMLFGNQANNILNGGAGADSMWGSFGDDTYIVDNLSDVVTEFKKGGTDTVQASVSYTLSANVENLTLLGTAAIDGRGNVQKNILLGNAGNNILNGGLGADTMKGGAGDDIYIVNDSGDVVAENAGQGTDTVKSWVSYALTDNVENLVLLGNRAINGKGNGLDNALTGNAAANTLEGGAGSDTLDGKAGPDTLKGGEGADSFVFSTVTGGADIALDFLSGVDKVQLSDGILGLKIGDRDGIIDNAALSNSHGGFSTGSELVIFTPNIIGAITTSTAATDIGSASSAFAKGDVRVFAVDNGVDSALYLFKSAGADALVSSTELTLIGTLQGTAQTALADYAFA